jgi:hypothetical protein
MRDSAFAPVEVRYDLVNYIIDVRLRPPKPGPKVTSLACEDSHLLLDPEGRLIGIEVVVREEDLAELDPWWSEDVLIELRQPLEFRWSSGRVQTRRPQEVILDLDEEGIYALEVMLFLHNRSLDFSLLREVGRSW